MLCRLYVSRNWMVSQNARRVYLVASIATLALIGSLIAISMAIAWTGQSLAGVNVATAVILYSILLIGIVGTATLRVAMLYYWYAFDCSGAGAKLLWLVAMFLFGPLTGLIYHFLIYRRRTAPQKPAAGV